MSHSFEYEGKLIATDSEGYLLDLSIWSPSLGDHIAHLSGITLTDAH